MTLYKEIENYSIDRQLEMICNEVDNLKVQIGMIVTGIEQLKQEFIAHTKEIVE